MMGCRFLRDEEIEQKLESFTEEQRLSLFEVMFAYRKQWRSEVRVSGWSRKYRELYSLQEEKIEELFGTGLSTTTVDRVFWKLEERYVFNG